MTDIASLTLAIDARQVKDGTKALDDLGKQADRTNAQTQNLGRTQSQINEAAKRLAQSQTLAAESARLNSKEFRSLDDSLTKLLTKLDPVYAKTMNLDKAQDLLTRGFKEGLISQTQFASGMAAAQRNFDGVAEAAGKSAFATAQARRELIVLGHEAVSGNFSRMPGSLLVLAERTGANIGLLGGLAAAALAAVAALGYLAVKTDEEEQAMSALNKQFMASGNSYAVATGQISALVAQLNQLPGVSKSAAEQSVAAFARIPEIGNRMRSNLLNLVPDISAAFGIEIPKAAQLLAESFAKPEEGAKKLDGQLNFLNGTQLLTIHNLELQGRTLDAQKVLYDALKGRVQGLSTEGLTPLQTSVNGLSHAWEDLMTSMGQSEGLHTVLNIMGFLVETLGKAVNHVKYLQEHPIKSYFWPLAALDSSSNQGPSASGQIKFNNAPTSNVSDNNNFVKQQVSLAEAYKGTRREISELMLTETGFRKAQELLRKENQQGTEQYKILGEAIADINQKIASLRKRGAGPKDDPTKSLLEDHLRILEDGVQREKVLLADRDKMLDLYNNENVISFHKYYEARKASAEESLNNQLSIYDKEIAALISYQAKAKRQTDKANAQVKIDALKDKETRLSTEAAQQSIVDAIQKKHAEDAYAKSIDEVNARVLALTGNLKDSAAIDFDRQNKQLHDRFTAEDNAKALAQLETLKKYAVAQGEVNDLQEKGKRIQEQLSIAEAHIQLSLNTGAISQLEALRETETVRKQAVQDLNAIGIALQKVADSNNFPKIALDADKFKLKIDELSGQTDLLAKKFDTIFNDSFSSAFSDFISGTKSMSEAFNSFVDDVVKQISRIAAEDIASSLFGSSGKGGIGQFFADIFGSGSSSGKGFLSDLFGGFFADGGTPPLNKISIVGENGPELFIPKTAGTIVPNSKISGGNTVIHMTINTPDANSFMKSRDQIAAQTQRAISRSRRIL